MMPGCRRFGSIFIVFSASSALVGCQAIGNFADNVGSHMPVIGERCEHWQCITESGREQSAMRKQMRAAAAEHTPAEQANEEDDGDKEAANALSADTPAPTALQPQQPVRKPVASNPQGAEPAGLGY